MKSVRKVFQKNISSELHSEWFFGSGKLPQWIGYRIGYLIVKSYIERNPTRLDVLVRLSSKEILEGSKF